MLFLSWKRNKCINNCKNKSIHNIHSLGYYFHFTTSSPQNKLIQNRFKKSLWTKCCHYCPTPILVTVDRQIGGLRAEVGPFILIIGIVRRAANNATHGPGFLPTLLSLLSLYCQRQYFGNQIANIVQLLLSYSVVIELKLSDKCYQVQFIKF